MTNQRYLISRNKREGWYAGYGKYGHCRTTTYLNLRHHKTSYAVLAEIYSDWRYL